MPAPAEDPRDRLIVALDVASRGDAERAVEILGDAVTFYKIGMQLAFSGGLAFAADLAAEGKKVFLDMKLLDIPNTVGHAVEAIARSEVALTTIHAYPQAMLAAVSARGDSGLKLLGVTVLTSLDAPDLTEAGYGLDVGALVERRAGQARDIGMDGLVCSAQEAARLRGIVSGDMLLVTPGIRPAGSDTGDQKRIATPARAVRDGADHLVVGRPVLAASDPRRAAEDIVAEIASALH